MKYISVNEWLTRLNALLCETVFSIKKFPDASVQRKKLFRSVVLHLCLSAFLNGRHSFS